MKKPSKNDLLNLKAEEDNILYRDFVFYVNEKEEEDTLQNYCSKAQQMKDWDQE